MVCCMALGSFCLIYIQVMISSPSLTIRRKLPICLFDTTLTDTRYQVCIAPQFADMLLGFPCHKKAYPFNITSFFCSQTSRPRMNCQPGSILNIPSGFMVSILQNFYIVRCLSPRRYYVGYK